MNERRLLPDSDEELVRLAWPDGLPADADGLFPPDSWLRRVSGQGAVIFGGPCALLLEVAHPLVAAGVADHSGYREDPISRLRRTLDAVSAMAFGPLEGAIAAARGIEQSHQRVQGTLRAATGRFPAGTPYHGRDPELVRWIWATLAHTAREVYERFVGPLDASARDAYHADYAVLARLLGVPPNQAPDRFETFRDWFDAMLSSDAIAVGDTARDIADSILHPAPASGVAMGGRLCAITTALLPAKLREAYALPFDADQESRIEAYAASVRALRRSPEGRASADG